VDISANAGRQEIPVEAVVFDFGKVLSLPPKADTMALLANIAGTDADTMLHVAMDNRLEYDRGGITGIEYYRKGLAAIGITLSGEALAETVRLDMESWAYLNPETVRLLEEIRTCGLKTGILSNMPYDFLGLAYDRFPVFRQVDSCIISCEHSVNKPEKAIYEILLADLALAAEEVIFFDDVIANVEGARSLGIKAYLWRGVAEARLRLASEGIALENGTKQ
jgi:putative hydrolase of the HAD superfamily